MSKSSGKLILEAVIGMDSISGAAHNLCGS